MCCLPFTFQSRVQHPQGNLSWTWEVLCNWAIAKGRGKVTSQQFPYWEETKLREEQQKLLLLFYVCNYSWALKGSGGSCLHRRNRKTARGINDSGLLLYRLNTCPNITYTDRAHFPILLPKICLKAQRGCGSSLEQSEESWVPLYDLPRWLKFLCV